MNHIKEHFYRYCKENGIKPSYKVAVEFVEKYYTNAFNTIEGKRMIDELMEEVREREEKERREEIEREEMISCLARAIGMLERKKELFKEYEEYEKAVNSLRKIYGELLDLG